MYQQLRAGGVEAELIAAEGGGLSVGADVFDGRNVDPVRLRNAHVAWIINNCRGITLEIVQRSEAPNNAWRNFKPHYRAKGTSEILRLSHEFNGKMMQQGEDLFQFMMEIDRLAADLHRLGYKSIPELRKCVIVVARLSADYEIKVRMLEKTPTSRERTETERVVANQYNRLFRQQQNSKALWASKDTTSVGRRENRRPRNRFKGICFICGRKGHHAWNCKGAKKKTKNPKMPLPTKAEVEASATSVGARSTLRIMTVAYAEAWRTGLAIVRSEELRQGCDVGQNKCAKGF